MQKLTASALILVLFLSGQRVASAEVVPIAEEAAKSYDYQKMSPETRAYNIKRNFERWDANKDGYIDPSEAPTGILRKIENGQMTEKPLSGVTWVGNKDQNSDGKISEAEFAVVAQKRYASGRREAK